MTTAWVNPCALRAAREDAGYTRRILAVDSGVPFADISRMERGVLEVDAVAVECLARTLGVPVDHIASTSASAQEAVRSSSDR